MKSIDCQKIWVKLLIVIPFAISVVVLVGSCFHVFEKDAEIVLSEICTGNYTGYFDEIYGNVNYIEFYNITDHVVDLQDYRLLIKKGKVSRDFPLEGKTIGAGEYYLLPVKEIVDSTDEHLISYDLDNFEEYVVFLCNREGHVLDKTYVPRMEYDVSYSREYGEDNNWQFKTMSPGMPNEAGEHVSLPTLKEPEFSLESGFYPKGTVLTLKDANSGFDKSEIYYTLDGTEPTKENGILYSAPLDLGALSNRPNLYADRTDISTGFEVEKIAETGAIKEAPGYQVPDKPVDKSVIVRAIVVGENGKYSSTKTATYFIGYDEKELYTEIPVISIITNPDNLFAKETGIYTIGNGYATMETRGWDWWLCNYTNRGMAWERPAEIQYFDADKNYCFSQQMGIRIKGNSSRAYSQKSLKLYARRQLDGNNRIKYPFFEDTPDLKSVALFNGGQDIDTRLKDYLVHNVSTGRSFETFDFIPCVLFLDGEYWGYYYITQEYNSEYIESKYGIDKNNVCIIKNDYLEDGTEQDYNDYLEFLDYFQNTDFSVRENYDALCEKMDIQSYVEYYCTLLYVARCEDWPWANYAIWKSREKGEHKYEDGKWRWMLFDVNAINGEMEEDLAEFDSVDFLIYNDIYFLKLVRIPEVKRLVATTLMDLMNTSFCKENITRWLEDYDAQYGPLVIQTLERYYGDNKGADDYRQSFQSIWNFFEKRKEYVLEDMKNELPLQGDLASVEIRISDTEAGGVKVNSVYPDLKNGYWCGEYFTDYPITVIAEPNDGYEFIGWRGTVESTESEIEVDLQQNGVVLEAVFLKK